jgi:hypothetical protein
MGLDSARQIDLPYSPPHHLTTSPPHHLTTSPPHHPPPHHLTALPLTLPLSANPSVVAIAS